MDEQVGHKLALPFFKAAARLFWAYYRAVRQKTAVPV